MNSAPPLSPKVLSPPHSCLPLPRPSSVTSLNHPRLCQRKTVFVKTSKTWVPKTLHPFHPIHAETHQYSASAASYLNYPCSQSGPTHVKRYILCSALAESMTRSQTQIAFVPRYATSATRPGAAMPTYPPVAASSFGSWSSLHMRHGASLIAEKAVQSMHPRAFVFLVNIWGLQGRMNLCIPAAPCSRQRGERSGQLAVVRKGMPCTHQAHCELADV